MASDHGERTPLYDGSIYDRRTAIEDPQQADHVRRKSWLGPGDCTCRLDAQGRYYNVCINAHCSRRGKACGGYCSKCFERHGQNVDALARIPTLDFHYLAHQRKWSDTTFGPGRRQAGVIDHIRKELQEVIDSGGDVAEWADVIILALDGATRAAIEDGGTVADVLVAVADKQAHNEAREWPDWRTQPTDRAIEHVRTEAGVSARTVPCSECRGYGFHGHTNPEYGIECEACGGAGSTSQTASSPPVFDDEFGLCMDPCEHPSINGTTCAACGEEVQLDG